MRTLYGYIRVSTVKQGERGVSLQEQREAIERYAASRSFTISAWYEERVTAAKRGRAAFGEMLKRLRAREADGVIIHKIDRGARNLKDWADLGQLIDEGIEVHFCNESLDLASRGGRLSADIQAVVAADYIRNLREETRKGFYGRLKQGLYPLAAPLGYLDRGKGKPKEPDPLTAPLVRQAFDLYATGSYNLHSLRAELHHLGLRNKAGGRLSINGLSTILNNPFYAGIIRIRRTNESFRGIHEPLIGIALFERVQAVLEGRFNTRAKKHDFVFRRLLTCKHCGYTLIGELQKGHVYYRCHTKGCPTKGIREDVVDERVRAALRPMQLSDAEFSEAMAAFNDVRTRRASQGEEILAALTLNQQRLEERMHRLTDAFLDGLIDRQTFEERKARLLRDRAALEERIAEHSANPHAAFDRIAQFLEQAKSFYSSYIAAIPLEKREFLRAATSNRAVDGKSIEIAFHSPYRELAERGRLACSDPYRDVPRTCAEWLAAVLLKHFGQRW